MRPQVALRAVLAVILAGALALAGCGGDDASDRSAAELIEATFSSDQPVESGRLQLGLRADLAESGTVEGTLTARFARGGEGQIPKLDGQLSLVTGGGSLEAGAISTGDKGYLVVAGRAYEVPAGDWERITKGYVASEREVDERRRSQPTLASLGIDPRRWLVDPRKAGEGEVEGVRTIRITAGVDVPRMVADVAKVAEGNDLSERLGADDVEQLERSVRSARVEIDTGREDERLRRLVVRLELASGTLELSVQYADLDEPQEIAAPEGARPLSELTEALERASGTGSGGGSDPYTECLEKAGADLRKVQRCAKHL
ncbi:MAG: hypothetical protein IRZ32_09100 [Solirubrobacteraceae bacterium]|nr:hypothetical protein [Solirubrobacteraceae bacterium]